MNEKKSAEIKYHERVNDYIVVENELIAFLKNATGEDLFAVFDTLKGVYDPNNEDSVLAAAYALEFDILTSEQERHFCTRIVHDREKKESFLSEHLDLICGVLTRREYDELINTGSIYDRQLLNFIELFERKKEDYFNNFDVVYRPYSLKFDEIIAKLKDISYWLYVHNKIIEKPKDAYDLECHIDPLAQSIFILLGCIGLLVFMFLLGSEIHRIG